MTESRGTERGSATVELVLIAPLLLVLALFVVASGRSGEVLRQVQHAADQGARAASQASLLRRDEAARASASRGIEGMGKNCLDPAISVETTKVGRLDAVRVRVLCEVNHVGLGILGLSRRTVSAESTEVIDVYRAR